MACSPSTLFTSACTPGFAQAAQNEAQWRALVLQLLYVASGSTKTVTELNADACTNEFDAVALNETQFRAIELQLLCAITGG